MPIPVLGAKRGKKNWSSKKCVSGKEKQVPLKLKMPQTDEINELEYTRGTLLD